MPNTNVPQGGEEKALPALRYKDEVALWPTKEGDKAALSGHVTVDGQKVRVRGFINDTDKEGNTLAHPYLSLTTNPAAEGQPAAWKTLAYGNAVNSRKDGKDVYFDQVIFNVAGTDKTFSAYVGKGCTEALHKQFGFTSAQIQRPSKEATQEAANEQDDEPAAAPHP